MKNKTKLCKHCQSEILKKAKVCPVCTRKQGSKLKWIIIAIVALTIIGTVTGGEDEDSKVKEINNNVSSENSKIEEPDEKETDSNEQMLSENNAKFEYGDCTVKYIRHEIMKNDIGETVLVVYYDFTNNGDDAQCFDYLICGKAFQGGVEVKSSLWHANEESKNSGKEIQKGTTLTVADSYVLGESRDNVTIEFRPFNMWSDKLLMSLELTLD